LNIAHESRSDLPAETPYHPVYALLGTNIGAGQVEHEFIGQGATLDVQANPAFGNIGDQAIARLATAADMELCHSIDAPTQGTPTVRLHCGFWHKHGAAAPLMRHAGRPTLDDGQLSTGRQENTYRTAVSARLRRWSAFSKCFNQKRRVDRSADGTQAASTELPEQII
jgi:hypothetical protein